MTNSTGGTMTPEEMSKLAEQQMKDRVTAAAIENPNTVQVGGQTGSVQTGTGMTPINFQADYQTPDKTNINTLTSNPANSYVEDRKQEIVDFTNNKLKSDYANSGQAYSDLNSSDSTTRLNAERSLAAQKESDINSYVKQVEGGYISNDSKNAYIKQLPPKDATETPQEGRLRSIVESGGAPGMSAGQALTTLNDLRKDRQQYDVQNKNLAEEQTSNTATSNAAAFKMGQSGGSYATSAAAKLKEKQDQQKKDFELKQKDALDAALSAGFSGNYKMAEQFRSEANRAFEQRMQIEQLAQQEQAQTMKMQEYEDTRAEKAQDRAMNTVGNLVKAGYTVDQIPKAYLAELDANSGMPKGFTSQLFDVAQAEKEAASIQDEEEQKTKRIDNARKIVDLLKDTTTGGTVNVGGVEYSVQGKTPDFATGTEMDDNGNATLWSFNKETGEVSTTPLGQIGTQKNGFETQVLGDGSIWRVNPKTGQSQPFYASEAQTTWNAVFPEGTTGPILPGGDPANAGQCAAGCNYWYDERILGDSYQQKQQAFNSHDPVSKEEVQIGDSFLMTAGTTGHVGVVNDVCYGPDGKVVIKCTESNYVPPGGGLLSHSRTMSIDDPKLKAFARIPTPNLPLAGSDSPITRVASGGASPAILGLGTKKTASDNLPSSVQEYEYAVKQGFGGSYADWKSGSAGSAQNDVTVLAKAAASDPKILEGLTPTVLTQVKAEMARSGVSVAPKSQKATQEISNLAKDILGDKNLKAAVGPISSYIPTIRGGTADFKGKVQQLKSLLTLDNLGIMKGTLSDSDIKILTSAATSLDLGLSEAGFKKELNRIIEKINIPEATSSNTTLDSAKNKYGIQY